MHINGSSSDSGLAHSQSLTHRDRALLHFIFESKITNTEIYGRERSQTLNGLEIGTVVPPTVGEEKYIQSVYVPKLLTG